MNPPAVLAHACLLAACALSACAPDTDSSTLYRNSPEDAKARIRVWTYAAEGGAEYNAKSCELAANGFRAQPAAKVRYWCEAGPYRK